MQKRQATNSGHLTHSHSLSQIFPLNYPFRSFRWINTPYWKECHTSAWIQTFFLLAISPQATCNFFECVLCFNAGLKNVCRRPFLISALLWLLSIHSMKCVDPYKGQNYIFSFTCHEDLSLIFSSRFMGIMLFQFWFRVLILSPDLLCLKFTVFMKLLATPKIFLESKNKK